MRKSKEFPLWQGRLRIQPCCSCDLGHSCGLDSISSLGTSMCCGCSHKKEREGKKISRKTFIYFLFIYFFCLFLLFLGSLLQHMEVPMLGVESEL